MFLIDFKNFLGFLGNFTHRDAFEFHTKIGYTELMEMLCPGMAISDEHIIELDDLS